MIIVYYHYVCMAAPDAFNKEIWWW